MASQILPPLNLPTSAGAAPGSGSVIINPNSTGITSSNNYVPPISNVVQGYMPGQSMNIEDNDHLMFNSVYFQSGTDITLDTTSSYTAALATPSIGRITVAPNHTYRLIFNANQIQGTGSIYFYWRDANTGVQIGLINEATPTGSFGDVIGYYQTTATAGLIELFIAQNNGITGIGSNLSPWFCVEEIA